MKLPATLNMPKPKSFLIASDKLDPIMSVIKSLTNTLVYSKSKLTL